MNKLQSQLEALLFIAAKPLGLKQLAELTGVGAEQVEEACAVLAEDYNQRGGGFGLVASADKYQLVSAPSSAPVVQKFIEAETSGELTRPSLEALTIIAYRGPVIKSELDKIRGVNCTLILRNLLLRGLIETKEEKGEIYYQVTVDFLRFLGVGGVSELPDYQRLSSQEIIEQISQEPQNYV